MFDRGESAGAQICTDWSDGVSWMAHPEEGGQRVSHAIRTADGVWLLDPLDAPDIDRVLADFGAVAGVAVLSCWHSRDADVFADRYDVPVSVPDWMGRVEQRIDAPLERYSGSFPDSSIRAIPSRPFSVWDEVILSHEASGTLIVPDSLGTIDSFLIGEERLGLQLLRRLRPPRQLNDLEPERVLVGHGAGITENESAVLRAALRSPRRRFPRALVRNGPATLRNILRTVG
ncbi:hypothetical protein CP556_10990 [Natrinema sp. CBA1119]|uniref:hypothetical protein n=1 Tax=Natrinema sp. CBA1119 TaxID=1608465 RepID=UPI000BFA287B|nr:hypothetical protein [Natrinema sp. CBA1119]PGF16592.1 hypothetical protein CP556_10990 [Natrinema sp. CBA1119]